MSENPEGQPKPNPERTFNPAFFISVARNPDVFRQLLPSGLRDINEAASPARNTPLADRVNDLQTIIPPAILDFIYTDFARGKRWLIAEPGVPEHLQMTQLMDKLAPEQEEDWNNFLNRGHIERDLAIDAFGDGVVLEFDALPVLPLGDSGTRDLEQQLRQVPYSLALKLFPDLSDEEARDLFDRSAQDVASIASGEIPPPLNS